MCQLFISGGWWWRSDQRCTDNVVSRQRSQCHIHDKGGRKTKEKSCLNFVAIQDFDNNNSSDCIGFEVSAITIIETTESYVNILLGDYKEPEASPTLTY